MSRSSPVFSAQGEGLLPQLLRLLQPRAPERDEARPGQRPREGHVVPGGRRPGPRLGEHGVGVGEIAAQQQQLPGGRQRAPAEAVVVAGQRQDGAQPVDALRPVAGRRSRTAPSRRTSRRPVSESPAATAVSTRVPDVVVVGGELPHGLRAVRPADVAAEGLGARGEPAAVPGGRPRSRRPRRARRPRVRAPTPASTSARRSPGGPRAATPASAGAARRAPRPGRTGALRRRPRRRPRTCRCRRRRPAGRRPAARRGRAGRGSTPARRAGSGAGPGAVRRPRLSRAKRSVSPCSTADSGRSTSAAAASSMASGMPSRWAISRATDAAFSSVSRKPGRIRAARSANSCAASTAPTRLAVSSPVRSIVGSGASRHTASPSMSSGSRLVTSTDRCGQCCDRRSTRPATASSRCSQLSRRSSSDFGASACTSRSSMLRPGCSATPTAAATAPGTSPGSVSGASSTIQAPSA